MILIRMILMSKNPQYIAAIPVQPAGFKLRAAAQYLGGLSVPTMHRLMKRGKLKPNRVLRHLIFSKEDLDRFLADTTERRLDRSEALKSE